MVPVVSVDPAVPLPSEVEVAGAYDPAEAAPVNSVLRTFLYPVVVKISSYVATVLHLALW